ncbi:Hpt domain-containing protein [Desulfopila aestuarii]|uniref:Hpt domain-containing protein n=1 Tax=Desulfopila aestuarii DSM 18488 TaxID=1121416 RepID=A0A1M7XW27_9BACT|nr:Hpt domain-containing protein [Desulfopila aestuarii]SHO42947.1 Hpt domain-containing protein [Desulfopila aestuarii DSM 18488]
MTETTPFPHPAPVTIAGLRNHFHSTYQLGEKQVELMVNSSRKSLDKILAEARTALQSDNVPAEMVNIGHSLKGLLLNMGEPEWAEIARDLEKSARAGEVRDYSALVALLTEGMATVLAYDEKE